MVSPIFIFSLRYYCVFFPFKWGSQFVATSCLVSNDFVQQFMTVLIERLYFVTRDNRTYKHRVFIEIIELITNIKVALWIWKNISSLSFALFSQICLKRLLCSWVWMHQVRNECSHPHDKFLMSNQGNSCMTFRLSRKYQWQDFSLYTPVDDHLPRLASLPPVL